jgi:peptide/nickel transport system permease protein
VGSYVTRRAGQAVLVVVGVTAVVFLLLNLLPGNVADAILGPDASKASYAALDQHLGLDHNVVVRYGLWLSHAVRGNLGTSLISSQPVRQAVFTRLPVTLELVFVAAVMALVASVLVACLAALRPEGLFDRLISGISSVGLSVPWFISGLIFIYVFSVRLKWLPAVGWSSLSGAPLSNLRYVALPSLTLAVWLFSVYVRVLRGDLVAQLTGRPYIETALAKGTYGWRLVTRHALRNSLGSLVSVIGVNLGGLLGGTVIVEGIFGLPGVGSYLLDGISQHDAPVVEGVVVVLSTLVVLLNLVADLVGVALDPARGQHVAA